MENMHFMERAVALSRQSMAAGGGPFGAVVVRDGKIIGEGMNSVTPHNDPTAHAEVEAIRNACRALETFDLSGSAIFTSCEPCPMCLSAIWWARIEKIYFSNTKEDAAGAGFDDAAIYCEISKKLNERTLPIERLYCKTSSEVFQLWQSCEEKTEY
ncbi:nucleoside deaminase [Desulfovibrio sp.]|uniref:nucleoside deaminase n=1 Tax=Desulfovibrio sp. TaxID=885 RepID=UPI0025C30DD8|nr:nucleoside deaminase [Desulfovibrio sp.]